MVESAPQGTGEENRLLGSAPSFSAVLAQVAAVAALNKPVLVVGERGTGKELIAARIHYLSARWEQAYHTLNCAAISETLIESELFGHEAGAFTGASRRYTGLFERANGGTLFMDELATSSRRVQEQLLRVIEYGEFRRLGGSESLATNVRIVAATNIDLPGMAVAGEFRHDLLDRLSFDVITLPPLRERKEDIDLLAEHFATAMSHELGRDYFAGFAHAALQQLHDYRWPGNVRELKNVIERSVYRHENWESALADIVFDPFASPYRPEQTLQALAGVIAPQVATRAADAADAQAEREASTPADTSPELPNDLKAWLQEQEVQCLRQALAAARYNQRKAAASIGLSYHQLRASLRKYPFLIDDVAQD